MISFFLKLRRLLMTGLLNRLLGRLWRTKKGTLVGTDEFGTRYYEQQQTSPPAQLVAQGLATQNSQRWMVPRGGQKIHSYDPDHVPGNHM